jgi:phosphate starvation-inducible PhoH-like protein
LFYEGLDDLKRNDRKRTLSIDGIDPMKLLGVSDRNIRIIEQHYGEELVVRGDQITVKGSSKNVEEITSVLERLIHIAKAGRMVTEGDVLSIIRGGRREMETIETLDEDVVFYSNAKRRAVVPRSIKQKEYVEAMRKFDVVFAIGPAGTGKTFLAMAMALAALKRKEVERIFISRPVVEAGESLGFLPGDLHEKIDPYLRPIFDAMRAMVGMTDMQKMIETGVVEITPLAYMRGRTLNDCFAVLDEAQNSTIGQMKMFLTRLGINARAVITGDITQIDLSDPSGSGLVAVRRILDGVEGIKFITFGEEDVVRHRLVKRIIKAFDALGRSLSEEGATVQGSSSGEAPDGKGIAERNNE